MCLCTHTHTCMSYGWVPAEARRRRHGKLWVTWWGARNKTWTFWVESTVSFIVEPSLQPLLHSFCCSGWKSLLASLSPPFPSTPPPFPSVISSSLLMHFLWDWTCAVYTGCRFTMCLRTITLIFRFSGLHFWSMTITGVCCPTDYRHVLPHPGYAGLRTGASTLGKRSSNRATASAQKRLLDFIFKLFIMKD